ncbi:MAG TPA: hypothetical protein VFI17_10480 [Solirubrobacterales bacterium]|nr:hypothetical protein [Solirubrobacterales bacterium]
MNAQPQEHGTWHISSAQAVTMPQAPAPGTVQFLAPPPAGAVAHPPPGGNGGGGGGNGARKRSRANSLAKGQGTGKRPRLGDPAPAPGPAGPPPLPQAVTTTSIGVMDIGQGNCNLLLEGAHPARYFDTGMPLWFHTSTAPNQIFANTPPGTGPITQKENGESIPVVLSHWDWDHWRLASPWQQLRAGTWYVPNQPRGPSANNFFNTLANPVVFGQPVDPANLAKPQQNMHETIPQVGFTLYRCWPTAAHPEAMVMNNTGLAISTTVLLPPPEAHMTLLTGDANFNSLPLTALNPALPLTGIVAVHHGSNTHGASQNLVNPVPPYIIEGRIAYSYGVFRLGILHAYGFPVPASVEDYEHAGWLTARSTAEGAQINQAGGNAHRGNVRMGDQTPIPAHFNPSCFAVFPAGNQLT